MVVFHGHRFRTVASASRVSMILVNLSHDFSKQQMPMVTSWRKDFTLFDHCMSMWWSFFFFENARIYLKQRNNKEMCSLGRQGLLPTPAVSLPVEGSVIRWTALASGWGGEPSWLVSCGVGTGDGELSTPPSLLLWAVGCCLQPLSVL